MCSGHDGSLNLKETTMADDKGQTASDRQRMSIATDEAAMSQNSKIATGVGAAASEPGTL